MVPSAETALPFACPICDRIIKRPHRAKTLYGFRVCKRCRNGLANRRQAAFVVDWILLLVIPANLVSFVFARLAPQAVAPASGYSPAAWWFGLDSPEGFFIVWILPFLFFCKDGFAGCSVGKWLTGTRVVDASTREPIGVGQSIKRNLVFLVPFSVLIGAATMMKGQRWGDGWANTMTVLQKHAFEPPFDPRGVLCPTCGYNLTGNVSGRCPECFTSIPAPHPEAADST